MTDVLSLYRLAEDERIDVDWFGMERAESLSLLLEDGSCAVAIDPWKLVSVADETVKLAHELGHCATGAFYNPYAALDVRQKHENRADRWAILRLVPREELENAVRRGYREPWELADFFGVTQDFIRKALDYYGTKKFSSEVPESG